jgi:AcrR family transcriptional regulator
MRRRQDIIDAAVALLREGGPDRLTTVAVAARLGMTQSAIYRHVTNVDELASLAGQQIVGSLHEALIRTMVESDPRWAQSGDMHRFSKTLVAAMSAEASSFAIVDRWRFEPGDLGLAIRELLALGRDQICELLEAQWRHRHGGARRLTPTARNAQRMHAQLIQDDVIDLAREVRGPAQPGGTRSIERVLETRMRAGYRAYVADMNGRLGLPIPEHMAPPVRPSREVAQSVDRGRRVKPAAHPAERRR